MAKEIIMYFIGFLFCLVNMTWIYTNLDNKKYKLELKSILLLLLFTTLAVVINLFKLTILNMLSSILFVFLIIKFVYKADFKKSIFYALYIWGFGMLFDFIFMSVFSYFSKYLFNYLSIIQYFTTYVLQILYNLISRITIFKIITLKMYNIFVKISLFLMLFIIIILALLGSNAIINVDDINKTLFLFIMGILVTMSITEYVIIKYLQLIYRDTNNILLKNNRVYVNINQETRQFKHNLSHKLQGLKLYSNKKTKLLLNEVLKDLNKLNCTSSEIDKLPHGINGLIQQKIIEYKCSYLNILVDNSLDKDILEIVTPRKFNKLCDVIGVTLDNALEAAINSEDKIIYIFVEETEDEIEIVIKNSFSSFLEIDALGTINYSTKGKAHGIGLFSVLFIKHIKIKINILNNMFVTKILVKK